MGVVSSNLSHLYNRLRYNQFRVLMVGLAGAGKTTILYKWKTGSVYETISTIGFNVETVYHKNIALNIWDINGQGEFYKLWHQYVDTDAPGVIFVLDSSDFTPGWIDRASNALHNLMKHENLQETVVLVIANKAEMPGAMSKDEIVENLKLKDLKQQWRIHQTSVVNEEGLGECLEWLGSELVQKRASQGGYLCS